MTVENNPTPPSPPPSEGLSGERHVSAVAGRRPFLSKKIGIGVMVTGAVLLCGLILLTGNRPSLPPDADPRNSRSGPRSPMCRRPCRSPQSPTRRHR